MARRSKHSSNGAVGLFEEAQESAPSVSVVEARRRRPSLDLDSPRTGPYEGFYRALGSLREEFHRIGRFDDANAKLEELCKLLAAAALDRRHPLPGGGSRLSVERLSGAGCGLAAALHRAYDGLAAEFADELSSFGGRPGLALAEDDDEFAAVLVPLLASLPGGDGGEGWSFDAVNEAFGHFVQDSFRNRKEDAQYMTPPEVVTPLVTLAVEDCMRDLGDEVCAARPLRVADPTCGVGSFLAAAYRVALGMGDLGGNLELLGQDKVDRMVRLANVNLRVFARTGATVRAGNSVLPPSGLDDWAGSVDLIVTNPPFGAEFDSGRVLAQSTSEQFPALHALRPAPKVIGSEYLLLDRGVSLLRPGGRMLIVVPDHVVSGTGFSERFRQAVLREADLEGVFDLPAEAFAQAGTRTRTSVVYLRRRSPGGRRGRHLIVMAAVDDLGFRVKSRTGATIKQVVGPNKLEQAVESIREFRRGPLPEADIAYFSDDPSVAAVADAKLLGNRWNAGFYRTDRLGALKALAALDSRTARLGELAEVDPSDGCRATAEEGYTCISVLHVREDGVVDLRAARDYRPTTPCVRCRPGDVLLSRINPHIMRVCVVPEVGGPVACSAEFAILRPRELSAAALALLLRSPIVQAQVRTLTSGTSSSHSRVKPRDLSLVEVPVPDSEAMAEAAATYERAVANYYRSVEDMIACDEAVRSLLGS